MQQELRTLPTITLSRVLWRTRGKRWDYAFVLRPLSVELSGWYGFHAEAFEGLTAGTEPQIRAGVLKTKTGQHPFVASVFQDEERLDKFDRPIYHYIACILEHEPSQPDAIRIPRNWGVQLSRSLSKEIDAIYASKNFGDGEDDVEECFSRACHKMTAVVLEDIDCTEIAVTKEIEVVEAKVGPNGIGAKSPIYGCFAEQGHGDSQEPIEQQHHAPVAPEMPSALLTNYGALSALLQSLIFHIQRIIERCGKRDNTLR